MKGEDNDVILEEEGDGEWLYFGEGRDSVLGGMEVVLYC